MRTILWSFFSVFYVFLLYFFLKDYIIVIRCPIFTEKLSKPFSKQSNECFLTDGGYLKSFGFTLFQSISYLTPKMASVQLIILSYSPFKPYSTVVLRLASVVFY